MANNDKKQIETETTQRLLLTEQQAAEALSISPRNLWNIRNRGEIPYLKNGRTIRYEIGDLQSWIKKNKTLPSPSVN